MSHCKYHPLKSATRLCASCDVAVCDDCSDESDLKRSSRGEYHCFVCSSRLDELEVESAVTPFWNNLSQVYMYPFGLSSIAAILFISLFMALTSGIFLLGIIPMMAMTWYCFACLCETAGGKRSAPEFAECFDGSLGPILYVIFATIIVSLAVRYAGLVFGIEMALLVMFFFILTLPAAIMVLAIDGNVFEALNPAKLMSVVVATGSSYFVMLAFMIIMTSSVGVLASLFGTSNSSFLGVFFQSLISNYYLVVEFHILGYIVYQNHQKLGFKVSQGGQDNGFRSDEKLLNARIETLIKAGDYESATDFAIRQSRQTNAQMWHWARCFKLMSIGGTHPELKRFASSYFDKLESKQQHDAVAEAYVMLKKRAPDYSVGDDKRCLRIADNLFEIGRYRFVVDMLKDFHTRSKDNEQINRALKLLSESYRHIPGHEKNAKFYDNVYQMRNSSV